MLCLQSAMDMVHIRHSLIGDEDRRGISGGQRKRVNVAIELMGMPLLLFLDEPTSGLDSTSTVELLSILQSFAKRNMTVAMVIHQPSYECFQVPVQGYSKNKTRRRRIISWST